MENSTNSSQAQLPDTDLSNIVIIMTALQLFVMVLIVVGNSLVLAAVCRFRTLQDVTGKFVANLALSDLILGLSLPLQALFTFYPQLEMDKTACLMRYEVIIFTSLASLLSLLCAVLDRFVIIEHPFFYHDLMTDRNAFMIICCCWVYAGLISFIPSFGVNMYELSPMCIYEFVMSPYYRLAIALHFIISSAIMFIIYMRISFIARKHQRQIETEMANAPQDPNFRIATKMMSVIAIVVLAFSVSWLPFCFVQVIQFQQFNPTFAFAGVFLVFLGIANSAMNPFIYAWKNRQYRRAFKKLLCLSDHSGTTDQPFTLNTVSQQHNTTDDI